MNGVSQIFKFFYDCNYYSLSNLGRYFSEMRNLLFESLYLRGH